MKCPKWFCTLFICTKKWQAEAKVILSWKIEICQNFPQNLCHNLKQILLFCSLMADWYRSTVETWYFLWCWFPVMWYFLSSCCNKTKSNTCIGRVFWVLFWLSLSTKTGTCVINGHELVKILLVILFALLSLTKLHTSVLISKISQKIVNENTSNFLLIVYYWNMKKNKKKRSNKQTNKQNKTPPEKQTNKKPFCNMQHLYVFAPTHLLTCNTSCSIILQSVLVCLMIQNKILALIKPQRKCHVAYLLNVSSVHFVLSY